jgi:gluconolactonase
MTISNTQPAMGDLIAGGAELTRVAHGFSFTEGPLWDAEHGRMLFTDIPGDALHAFDGERVSDVRRPSNKANGLAFDREGRLVACEHATSRVSVTEADGSVRTLASHYDGKELNSPNDVVVRSDGTVFFTDPPFGRAEFFGVPREQELDFQGVYLVRPGGEPVLLADDFQAPNGLCLSADERRLFVNDSPRMEIRVFDVEPDGTLSNGETFLTISGDPEAGVPDGMKLDEHGNVWVSGPGGVWVIDPAANVLGVVDVPEIVGNLAWGGFGRDELYVAASTSLYRIRTLARGAEATGDATRDAEQ